MFAEMVRIASLETQFEKVADKLMQDKHIKTLCNAMNKEEFCDWCLEHSRSLNLPQQEIDILTRYMLEQRKVTLQAKQITDQQVKGLKQMIVGNMNFRKKDKKEIDKFIKAFNEEVEKSDNMKRIILGLSKLRDFDMLEILSNFLVEVNK